MKRKNWITYIVVSFILMPQMAYADLVVFSGRKEPLIKPVIQLFEKETGIKVTLKTGKSAALGQQILQELPTPSADVFIAKESGSLEYLKSRGAFDSYESKATNQIGIQFKDRQGYWVGVSGRSRAVIYNKSLISEDQVPQTLSDLTDSKYKGKIAAVNAGNESFVAWVSGLRLHLGDEATKNILEKLKANKIQLLSKSHTDVRKAVGRGEYPLGLINHYYYHLQKNEIDKSLTDVGIVYLDQGASKRGELVNVCGAAIVKGASNAKEAALFIDFLVSEKAQELFANVNFEYPMISGVKTNAAVTQAMECKEDSAIDCLTIMNVNLDQFGQEMDQSIEMLEDVDWY